MVASSGHGGQVVLTGEAQAAARGAVSDSQGGNLDAREAATPLDNYGTPAPLEPGIGDTTVPTGPISNSMVAEPFTKAANDVDAAAKGVAVGGFYMNTAGIQQRLT